MRVSGHSMPGAGILDGDPVVVDRSLEPRPGHIVVAFCRGELTPKRLRQRKDGYMVLAAEHPDYPELVIGEERPAEVWGVVVGCVRKLGPEPIGEAKALALRAAAGMVTLTAQS
jgi:DNA polymerase V